MTFFVTNHHLSQTTENILEKTWQKFPSLKKKNIALTVVMENKEKSPLQGFSYRGNEKIYPASIVKLFYLVAVEEWLNQGKIQPSSEFDRAVRDMIVESSNDATSLVMDTLTQTTSGYELPELEFLQWQKQRNMINDYFQSYNWEEFASINVNQKTWCDGAYGRERIFLGENYENRNMLTTNAVARLLYSIMNNLVVTEKACEKMRNLLKRDASKKKIGINDEENQINGFIGESVPNNAQIWSKAGWTSQVRHDCAYITLPNSTSYLLVIFAEGKATRQRNLIPFISHQFIMEIQKIGALSV
ncbi:MAG: serine hydrolase [Geminocystis sp.]